MGDFRKALIENYAKMYAKSLILHGVDIEGKYETATKIHVALEEAYMRGRQDERDEFARWAEEHLSVEPPRGEWIEEFYFDYRCSSCGSLAEFRTDFCPHCGCDMRSSAK